MDGGAWWAAVHGVAKSWPTERPHFHFSLSCIGEGNGSPLQCSCLESPRDGGACWAAVCGVARSRTRLQRLSSSGRVPAIPHLHQHLVLSVFHILVILIGMYFIFKICISLCQKRSEKVSEKAHFSVGLYVPLLLSFKGFYILNNSTL